MLEGITRRWQQWVDRRTPRTDSRVFRQKNIYILPTGAGMVFCLLLVVMLLTAINYQNSLVYLLTFLLGTVLIGAMHQTHQNLSGLEVALTRAGEGFAGDQIPFVFRATAANHDSIGISLYQGKSLIEQQHVVAGSSLAITMSFSGHKRGYLRPGRVCVETRFPFGLFKAWSWVRPESQGLVYPRPISCPDIGSLVVDEGETQSPFSAAGMEHAELRPWRQGDLSQRILWKRYARSGEMVIAEWEAVQGSPQWLDYDALSGIEPELRLSYLTYQVLERARTGQAFGLRLPGNSIAPDSGRHHVVSCLRALATHGLEPGGNQASMVGEAELSGAQMGRRRRTA